MSGCCDKNPLHRGGTSREQRYLDGLREDYVSIDERRFADWIFFAQEFSRFLNFYDATNTRNGDWKSFFSLDISAILGSIAVQDVETYRLSIKARFDFLKDNDNAADTTGLKQKLNELFSAIVTLSKSLDDYLYKLPEKNATDDTEFVFRSNLLNLIKTKLSPSLTRLISYYKAVDGDPMGETDLLEISDMSGWRVLNASVQDAAIIFKGNGLSGVWLGGAADWATYLSGVSPDDSIYGPAVWPVDHRINHAANHNLFASVFDQFLQSYTRIIKEAENNLLSTLENWNMHGPHYALFLSFLRLFRTAQSQLNTLTRKHLDFYYREVLQLKLKDAEPNHVHILAELAKSIDDYALKTGTAFKAGKDSAGAEVTYELGTETAFNKARVAQLKSLYKADAGGKDDHHLTTDITSTLVNNQSRFFASTVANSDDGEGAKLRSSNNEWSPYANKRFTDGILTDISMPLAKIGFAVASHYLFLGEGVRTVYLKLALSNNALLTAADLDIFLTTAKEWYPVPSMTISAGTIMDSDGTSVACTQISFTLTGDVPPITKYDASVHGGTYAVQTPVMKIILKNEDGTTAYRYEDLKGLMVSKYEIRVEVGDQSGYSATGLKQLLLSNDFGPIDASKPFMPFGAQPKRDASLVIGNKEAFSKQNLSIRFNIEWADYPSTPGNIDYERRFSYAYNTTTHQFDYSVVNNENTFAPTVYPEYLSGSMWLNESQSSPLPPMDILGANPSTSVFGPFQNLPSTFFYDYKANYPGFDIKAVNGFVRLKLERDLGHEKYLADLTQFLIEKSGNVSPKQVPQEPVAPYTPVIKSMYMSYAASAIHSLSVDDAIAFDERPMMFFSVYPFGEAEQHAHLSGANGSQFLFPQFSHTDEAGTTFHTGEFYIGLEKLSAEQSVNILFQLLEGSSNPLVAKPEDHIHWSYLSNNKWIAFDKQSYSDATLQWVQSGIISFVVPVDATTGNTLLPSGYLWLRAAVASAADAVCKLITVDAQAAKLTFHDNGNAADFLDSALAAGTISKLKEPDASVKKINQPYSSFGGRSKESPVNFYVRVSERLRHKARAITIWDYEHLVLEAFPSIHKVKCLNHTFFDINPDTGLVEYNEVAPGNVTIITIPDLSNRNDSNPLRPYTSQDVLTGIEDFLREKISCHVKLRAKNPRFEEVSVEFKLKLRKGYDDFTYYSNQLKKEITGFLTPWAYGNNSEIEFGGKIRKSVIIDFIEERAYVDYITDVKMYQNVNPDNEDAGGCDDAVVSGDIEDAQASTARSILVSAPWSKHIIEPAEEPDEESEASCKGLITEPPVVL